jgi:O-acetylserine/cysteine efflux transporter
MLLFGSAFVVGKLILNTSVPPILYAALRMGIVFICLLPFWKFEIPSKKYFFPLLIFALSMGVGVSMFTQLAINESTILSPVIIGGQLAVPFALILSSFFLGEKISSKKWFFVLTAFFGIILIGFDPKLVDNMLALFLTSLMAFFYGISNVASRNIKNLRVTLSNGFMGFLGLIILLILSFIFEGNIVINIKNIESNIWILIIYAGAIVSVVAHMSLFYLYKFYSVDQVLPYYALFPVFGLIQTFIVFHEIPSFLVTLGGIIVIGSVYMVQKIR